MSTEDNKALVRRTYDVINKRNLKAIDELVDPNYVGHIPGSPEGRRWFSVWYEKVYAKRDGRWVYLSHRTVDGAHYGNDRESVSLH